MSDERRLSFGRMAELYDLARPSYPAELVDDVVAYAGAGPGDPAVEVGAGTGKATALFAARGLSILALEPSHEMAEIARRNLAGYPDVAVEEVEFEPWVPQRSFKLVYSAQAWHWIERRARFERAAEALSADGALAAFWNRVRWEALPLSRELDALYRRLVPELGSKIPPGPMLPGAEGGKAWYVDWQGEPGLDTGFTEPEWRTYVWPHTYATEEYLSLLRTHSDHAVLEPERREALLQAVGETIDRAGGRLEIEYVTHLGLARPA